MNQVQELMVLNDARRIDEGLERLQGLMDVMARQPGFLHMEVCRGLEQPERILALHAWETLEAWQTFSASQWKRDFIAARPEGLYEFETIGMNWTVDAPVAPASDFLRRTVSTGSVEMHTGAVAQQAGRYADDLPQFAGADLVLTYYGCTADCTAAQPAAGALVDEPFEVMLSRVADKQPATAR
jgi:heme-degrading monooxygenase HmoA